MISQLSASQTSILLLDATQNHWLKKGRSTTPPLGLLQYLATLIPNPIAWSSHGRRMYPDGRRIRHPILGRLKNQERHVVTVMPCPLLHQATDREHHWLHDAKVAIVGLHLKSRPQHATAAASHAAARDEVSQPPARASGRLMGKDGVYRSQAGLSKLSAKPEASLEHNLTSHMSFISAMARRSRREA